MEVKAWTVRIGAKAPEAAGVIHSDFEKGFIKAETISYEDYVTLGGEAGAREAGRLRMEGKDYVMGPGSVSYGDDEDFSINECPLSVMRDAGVLDSMEGTTPVFVLKRVAGEGRDMPRSMYNRASSAEDRAKRDRKSVV